MELILEIQIPAQREASSPQRLRVTQSRSHNLYGPGGRFEFKVFTDSEASFLPVIPGYLPFLYLNKKIKSWIICLGAFRFPLQII